MKSTLMFFISILSININAQVIPNITTKFSDLTEDILKWEIEEGDIALYKYDQFHLSSPKYDRSELIKSQIYIKLFFSENRKELISAIVVIIHEDQLLQAEYTIYSNKRKGVLDDKWIVFEGENSDGLPSSIAILPEKNSFTIYVGIEYPEGIYASFSRAEDTISKVWYEDVIRESTQADWNNVYDLD
jgi:hypothetical protein